MVESKPAAGVRNKINSALIVKKGITFENRRITVNYCSILVDETVFGVKTLAAAIYSNGATHSEEERERTENEAE